MKSIKILMMVVLLTTGLHVFATIDKNLEQNYNEFKKNIKKIIDERDNLKKNCTPFQKASIETTDLALSGAGGAITIGLCSCILNSTLASFEETKDLKNRGTVSTAACASLLMTLYASYSYEEMQKSKDKKISFYDWLSSFVK